jgi:oligopeptide transport system substrate-binding protein
MPIMTLWAGAGRAAPRFLAALFLGFAFAACSNDAGIEPRDDVLRRANGAEVDSLDPHKMAGVWEDNVVSDLFMGYYTHDPHANVIKGLVDTHEISEDGLVHTLTIRRDALWSDGTPVTAHDFVFGHQRVLDPMTAGPYAEAMYPIKNAEQVNSGKLPTEELGVRALDDHTVEITLEHPVPYIRQLLAHYTSYPVPRHVIEKHGDRWARAGIMVSNGPYVLTDWRPNEYIKLTRNEKFWDAENVAIREVYFLPITDASTAERRFRAGEVDLTSDFPSQRVDWLRENLPRETRTNLYVATTYAVFNVTRPPFEGERGRLKREALALALNRQLIADEILRVGQMPAYHMVPPAFPDYENTAKMYFHDMPMEERIERARAIMRELGYGPDNPLRFEYRYRDGVDNRRVAIAMASMWRDIYAEVDMINTEVKTHYADLQEGNFTAGDAGWVGSVPIYYMRLLESRMGQLNYGSYSNPDYDALIHAANHEADPQRHAEILARAEQIMLDDYPIIPVVFGANRALVGNHVKGYEDNNQHIHRTRFMWIERDAEGA